MSDAYGMKCRILSDDPRYVHGWEMGMLWCRMAGLSVNEPPRETHIEQTIHSVNDEQLVVVAGVTGWRVVSIERVEGSDYEDTWSLAILERP